MAISGAKKLAPALLALILGLVLSVTAALILPSPSAAADQPAIVAAEYGAGANPTGDPVGGGKGYSKMIAPDAADYRVSTRDQLVSALGSAERGQVIYVEDSARINLTGVKELAIPDGVVIASGRGRGGSPGALLFNEELLPGRSFVVCLRAGSGVRLTGLRLRGPDPEIGRSGEWAQLWEGVSFGGDGGEVDNCDISQWGMGLVAAPGTRDHRFHHNYIHHCRRSGFGYGVAVVNAQALIECNYFDYNRHSIMGARGSSPMPSSYEARYNFCGPNGTHTVFDCHGGNDAYQEGSYDGPDGDVPAGGTILVHHNTSAHLSQALVGIRGIPSGVVKCYRNWTYLARTRESVYSQHVDALGRKPYVKMQVYDNWSGGQAPPEIDQPLSQAPSSPGQAPGTEQGDQAPDGPSPAAGAAPEGGQEMGREGNRASAAGPAAAIFVLAGMSLALVAGIVRASVPR